MGESYLHIRKELEEAIQAIASIESELGGSEETIKPIQQLAEALHSPFCMVVLGEKGAGKSSLLNAFVSHDLSRVDGAPERIRVFRYGKEETNQVIAEDLEECCRPLPFLHEYTLIDTPANLLLGDARLLTRDIFPIADLVLCVFSVNNPWAPSTWEFLRNAKKDWLSKVAFVVQQTDLSEEGRAQAVAKSLAAHAHESLGVLPTLFEISAKVANAGGPDARARSGIEALEAHINETTAASQVHINQARSTCQAARGALIDLAERVRGAIYLANLENSKNAKLKAILDECKTQSDQEIQQIIQSVVGLYQRSQAHGEELLKEKLSLLQTLKSAFSKNDWTLPFLDNLEKEVRAEIATAAEAIKTHLLAGSQRFLESLEFRNEQEQTQASSALAAGGKQLGDQIKKTLTRNRSEGLEDVMNDLLDGAGAGIRLPAVLSLVGLVVTVISYASPMIFGIAAALTAVALTVTLFVVVQKHKLVAVEFQKEVAAKRERVLSTIERQLKESVEAFCNKHLLHIPPPAIASSALSRLEPVLPRIKELEDSFSSITSKLGLLLVEES